MVKRVIVYIIRDHFPSVIFACDWMLIVAGRCEEANGVQTFRINLFKALFMD